jgi:hypothetical protein
VKIVQDVKSTKNVKAATLLAPVLAFMLAVVACGGGSKGQAEQTPTTQAAVQTPVPAAQQAAQNTQRIQTANAVDFEQLAALIPEYAGWTRSTPRGEQYILGVPVSRAEANYEKGESSIKLQITDTAFSQVGLAPYSMMLLPTYFERSSDGYKKAASLGGSPGFETWDSVNKDAEVTVVVVNRFVVMAKGRNVDSTTVVRALVQAVDLAKLAAIK